MKVVLSVILFLFTVINANGQSLKTKPLDVKELTASADSFAVRMPVEKVYLHIDKPYYTNTDTIWFKAYVLNSSLEASRQSGVLYTELINDTGRVVARHSIAIYFGLARAQIALDSSLIHEGSYTLRAYTNWMQNLGEQSFFTRPVYIAKAGADSWLVKTDSKTTRTGGRDSTSMAVQLLGADNDPVRLQDVNIRLTDGRRSWLRDKLQTDVEGKLRFNFTPPPKPGRLTLLAEAKRGSGRNAVITKMVIPVNLNRNERADIQFMPEGGRLVAGLLCKIAFKAIAEDGKGIDLSGVVVDSKGAEQATFASSHKDMGSFIFTPQANEVYRARVSFSGSAPVVFNLPGVKPTGLVLAINNLPGRDSVVIGVQATDDVAQSGAAYTIIGQSGDGVYYSSTLKFKPGAGVTQGRVAKSRFPSGITRFTLFDETNSPVAERIIFIDHHDRLNINISTDKDTYRPADSVVLNLAVSDKEGKPLQGSFSIAVTDDEQVKTDSTNVPDMAAYMLLQSELKGIIEEPGYYFTGNTPAKEMQLDNLLLAQGWVAYDWKQVLDKQAAPQFNAEQAGGLSGIVKRLSKPQAGLPVNLLSLKSMVFRDTITDAKGRFSFAGLPQVDTPAYVVLTKDKRGKIFEANVYIDEFTPAGTSLVTPPLITPWYVNTDSTLLNYTRSQVNLRKYMDNFNFGNGLRLKEVVIKGKKVVKNSKNINGPGNADLIIDEETLLKKKNMTMRDMIAEGMIKGVRLSGRWMKMREKSIIVIIDGIHMRWGDPFNILPGITAADIRGIEIAYNTGLIAKYVHEYDPDIAMYVRAIDWPAYMEITTWSGNGPFMKRTHSRAVYRPMPLTVPKAFYIPKYSAVANPLSELRATLHWEPDIVTDTAGNARVVLYLKRKKGTYSFTLQGTDLNGHIGCKTQKLTVF